MTQGPNATYHCTVCGLTWSYEAVRHLACCRDCGSGLVRTLPTLDRGGAVDHGEAGRRQRQPDASADLGTRPAAPIRLGARGGGRCPRPRIR
jgi:predicted  nucleic acid-binding Zn-ribbon protein